MLSYQRLKHLPRALRAFTGLDQVEFEKLLPPFVMAYHAYMYDQHVKKKSRKRRYGGGRKPRLAAMEDKLLFILFYFKVYPLQEVMAFLFDTSQGRVNEWIHKIDGTEWRTHRPKDSTEQKEKYSGKKKRTP